MPKDCGKTIGGFAILHTTGVILSGLQAVKDLARIGSNAGAKGISAAR